MMKNLLSKVVLLSLFGLFILSSCSKDGDGGNGGDGKVSVTEKYRIIVNAGSYSSVGSASPALSALKDYTDLEIETANKAYGKAEWTITEKGATKEEASAAADKKAIELFNSSLPDINKACASIKTKFEAKRSELASEIAGEKSMYHINYTSCGGFLQKEKIYPTNPSFENMKDGDVLLDFEAIGGTQY